MMIYLLTRSGICLNVTFVTLRLKFLPPRKVKTLVKIFRIAKIGEKWLSIGVPPILTWVLTFAGEIIWL